MANWDKNKAALQARLKRAEGQVRAVHRMLEEEQDCEKIAQQLAAARRALETATHEMIACQLERDLDAGNATTADIARYTRLLAKYA